MKTPRAILQAYPSLFLLIPILELSFPPTSFLPSWHTLFLRPLLHTSKFLQFFFIAIFLFLQISFRLPLPSTPSFAISISSLALPSSRLSSSSLISSLTHQVIPPFISRIPLFPPSLPLPSLPWMCAAACGAVGKSRWRRNLNEKECNVCGFYSPRFQLSYISHGFPFRSFLFLFLAFPFLSNSHYHSPSFTFLSLSLSNIL